jgi:HAD superfamily hydrolase (TIGR01509 family)
MKIQGVIFDCDGTLVDSETISLKVLVDFVAEFGLVIPHEEAMERFAGGQLPIVFAEIEAKLGRPLPEDFLDQFRGRQLAALGESVEPIDGAHELLSSLDRPFCVASNAPLNKVRLCLETAKLMELIPDNQLHSAYEIDIWKPEPDLFFKAATAIGVPPAGCAVVEDSGYGIDAGLNAGMKVFALDPLGKLPKQHASVVVIQSLRELVPLLS